MSDKKPLFVFFGTPRFAVHVLSALEAHGLLPALVVSAPDKPQGRGLVLTPTPAKVWAEERGIDVLTPSTLKDGVLAEELSNTDWDFFLVAAYAKLIPKSILDIPRLGSLNVHPSLLPKFRGPSPALSAILANERTTGVSIMQLVEQMDAGPVVAQARIEIDNDPSAGGWPPKGSMFEDLLATEGGNLLAETIPLYMKGAITPEPQVESEATFTKKFTDEDSVINLSGDAMTELCKIRAFDRNPRAHYIYNGKRVIITEAHTENGTLVLDRVIPEGKKEMEYSVFISTASK